MDRCSAWGLKAAAKMVEEKFFRSVQSLPDKQYRCNVLAQREIRFQNGKITHSHWVQPTPMELSSDYPMLLCRQALGAVRWLAASSFRPMSATATRRAAMHRPQS